MNESGLYTLGTFGPTEIWSVLPVTAALPQEDYSVRNKFNKEVIDQGFELGSPSQRSALPVQRLLSV